MYIYIYVCCTPCKQNKMQILTGLNISKYLSCRLHATCGGGQTELRRGIHMGFSFSFYTAQYKHTKMNSKPHGGLSSFCTRDWAKCRAMFTLPTLSSTKSTLDPHTKFLDLKQLFEFTPQENG